jgi:hypothetical protein
MGVRLYDNRRVAVIEWPADDISTSGVTTQTRAAFSSHANARTVNTIVVGDEDAQRP